jgi:hypothetical protein
MNVPNIGEEFAGAELGDIRRTRRLQQVAQRIADGPGRSVPKATGTDAELEGCYRLLNNEEVEPRAILAPHQRRTVERAEPHREVVVVHDTTALRLADQDTREGLGPLLAKNGVRGFYAHVAMAVALTDVRDPLGVLGLHTYVRSEQAVSSKKTKSLTDPGNEYHRFARLIDQSEALLVGRARAIHVIDREADVYELFSRLVACNYRFVIRLSDDRATPERVEGTKRTHVKLSDIVQSLAGMAEREVPLSPRRGSPMPYTKKIHPTREGLIAKLSTGPRKLVISVTVAGGHAALSSESTLARVFSKDFCVQLKGAASWFHSTMKARILDSRSGRSAKLGIFSRLRCRIENHCSTWFIHEQCTGVK